MAGWVESALYKLSDLRIVINTPHDPSDGISFFKVIEHTINGGTGPKI